MDWWKKTPKDYTEQMERYCVNCGVPFPLIARLDSDGIDDVSSSNLEKLKAIGSPKIQKGRYRLYNGEYSPDKAQYNNFRCDFEYFNRIAAKYNLYLKPNDKGFLQPFMMDSC